MVEVPIALPKPGNVIVSTIAGTADKIWISGVAFSTNPWNHAHLPAMIVSLGVNSNLLPVSALLGVVATLSPSNNAETSSSILRQQVVSLSAQQNKNTTNSQLENVIYVGNGKSNMKSVNPNTQCSDGTFGGDPNPGATKVCVVQSKNGVSVLEYGVEYASDAYVRLGIPGTLTATAVPVVPSDKDKLLYISTTSDGKESNTHCGVFVNNVPVERFKTTYKNNPFAVNFNNHPTQQYLAVRVPKELIGNSTFIKVTIDSLYNDFPGLTIREIGTHDLL
jgi:hypothetical protein